MAMTIEEMRELNKQERTWQKRLARKKRDWKQQSLMRNNYVYQTTCYDCGKRNQWAKLRIDKPEQRVHIQWKYRLRVQVQCQECEIEEWYAKIEA